MIDSTKIKQIAKDGNLDISKYDIDELRMGFEVEKEHDKGKTDVVGEPSDLIKIAMAHLDELPDYYTRLKKMEKNEGKKLSSYKKMMMELHGLK